MHLFCWGPLCYGHTLFMAGVVRTDHVYPGAHLLVQTMALPYHWRWPSFQLETWMCIVPCVDWGFHQSLLNKLKRICVSIKSFLQLGSGLFLDDGWPCLALISDTSVIFGFWLLVLTVLRFCISLMIPAHGVSSVYLSTTCSRSHCPGVTIKTS